MAIVDLHTAVLFNIHEKSHFEVCGKMTSLLFDEFSRDYPLFVNSEVCSFVPGHFDKSCMSNNDQRLSL